MSEIRAQASSTNTEAPYHIVGPEDIIILEDDAISSRTWNEELEGYPDSEDNDEAAGLQEFRIKLKREEKQSKEHSGLRSRKNKKSHQPSDNQRSDWAVVAKHHEIIGYELQCIAKSIKELAERCKINIPTDTPFYENPLVIIPLYGPAILAKWLKKVEKMSRMLYNLEIPVQQNYGRDAVLRSFAEHLPSIFIRSCKVHVLVAAAELPLPGQPDNENKLAAYELRRIVNLHRVIGTLDSMSSSGEKVLGWLSLVEAERLSALQRLSTATDAPGEPSPSPSPETQPLLVGKPTLALEYSEQDIDYDQALFNAIPSIPTFNPWSTAKISKLTSFLHDTNTLWLIVLLLCIISAYFAGLAFANDSPMYTPLSQLFRLWASLWCMVIPLFRDRTLPIWPARAWLHGSVGLSAGLCVIAVGLCKTNRDWSELVMGMSEFAALGATGLLAMVLGNRRRTRSHTD